MVTLAVVDHIGVRPHIACAIEQRDAHDVGGEHLAQLVADEVDDALQLEVAGEPLLDAVDHREFGVARFGLLQQPDGLVEQAHVPDRDGGLAGEGLDDRDLALVQELGIDPADADHADDLALADQRHGAGHAVAVLRGHGVTLRKLRVCAHRAVDRLQGLAVDHRAAGHRFAVEADSLSDRDHRDVAVMRGDDKSFAVPEADDRVVRA